MTVQEKFEKWREDYRLKSYDYDDTYIYEDQLAAYLAAAKEARDGAIRECAKALDQLTGPDASITWNDAIVESKFAILALLEKQ